MRLQAVASELGATFGELNFGGAITQFQHSSEQDVSGSVADGFDVLEISIFKILQAEKLGLTISISQETTAQERGLALDVSQTEPGVSEAIEYRTLTQHLCTQTVLDDDCQELSSDSIILGETEDNFLGVVVSMLGTADVYDEEGMSLMTISGERISPDVTAVESLRNVWNKL